MRGLAILLVIVSHAVIPTEVTAGPGSRVLDAIYLVPVLFHMPLFMGISGFVSFGPRIDSAPLRWIGGRARQLVAPYGLWLVIGFFEGFTLLSRQGGILPYLGRGLVGPAPGLWFLYQLFFALTMLCLAVVAMRWLPPLVAVTSIAIALGIVSAVGATWFGLSETWRWFLWVAFGYLAARYASRLHGLHRVARVVAPFAFVALVVTTKGPGPHWLPGAAGVWVPYFVTAATGVLAADSAVALLSRAPGYALLAKLGRVTLPIYVGQSIFFATWHDVLHRPLARLPLQVVPLAAAALAVGLALWWVLSRNEWSNALLAGGCWPRKRRA